MRQGGGYEQLEMAELEAEIAELQSELRPQGERGGGESPTTPWMLPTPEWQSASSRTDRLLA
jgi:hypothetical protein